MKKIAAFAGSNNPQSINQQLATYASSLISGYPSTIINLRNYPFPIFSIETLQQHGAPQNAIELRELLENHDAFIISVGEYNRSVSAVFKNTMDWVSKAGKDYNVFNNKPVLVLGTSPSADGAKKAIEHAEAIITELKGNVINKFSIPGFYQNVEINGNGFQIKNENLHQQLHELVKDFEKYN